MSAVLGKVHVDDGSAVATPASEETVRHQLKLILASPAFQGSKRCQRFLEHVCDRSLAGATDALKERNLAVEVFGRSPGTDLAEDTIVRVGAREVRKRLAQYYGTPEGLGAPIRIEIPPGAYVPEFHVRSAEVPVEEVAPAAVPASVPIAVEGRWTKRYVLTVGGIAALVLVAAAAFFYRPGAVSQQTSFEKFWAPVFQSRQPLLLAVGHPLVYHPSLRAQRMNLERNPPGELPLQRPLNLPARELDGSDLVPVSNQYVGFGDMVVATQISHMLGKQSKDYRIRLASNVPFADLRKAEVLLVGAITNHWTLELGREWRFRFDRAPNLTYAIVDSKAPAGGPQSWSVVTRANGEVPEDYLLISRVPHASTGGVLIVAGGIKHYGTEAAGNLLTDANLLNSVLAKLPSGWEDRNLQIVMSVKVIGNTPAQPEIVAWHTW